jgi:hypothetical protein
MHQPAFDEHGIIDAETLDDRLDDRLNLRCRAIEELRHEGIIAIFDEEMNKNYTRHEINLFHEELFLFIFEKEKEILGLSHEPRVFGRALMQIQNEFDARLKKDREKNEKKYNEIGYKKREGNE